MFSRVENMEPQVLAGWLKNYDCKTVEEYYKHLESLPLGPNVASFLGHSNLRMKVMGLERSLKEDASDQEIKKMFFFFFFM